MTRAGRSRLVSRRALLRAGVSTLGTIALAACAPTPAQDNTAAEKVAVVEATPGQVTKEPVEIRWAYASVGGNAEEADRVFGDCASDVMEGNPGIAITLENRPGQGMWDKFQTEFAAGTAPDVIWNQINWIVPGAARGMFLDLKPYMERDSFPSAEYWYPMDAEWGWRGGSYATLFMASAQAHFVNKTLLAQEGMDLPADDWTWDDLLAYGQAITDKETMQWGILGANASPPYWLASFIHGAGGSVLNDAYNKCTLTEPEAIEGIQWVADLMFDHGVLPTPSSIEGLDNPFLTGKVGLWYGGSFNVTAVRQGAQDQGFEWEFVHAPINPATGIRSVQTASNAWSVMSNSQHKEEAWQLAKYLGDVDGQRRIMHWGLPGPRVLVESQEFLDAWAPQNPLAFIDDVSCCGHDYYQTADCGEWWAALGQELAPIWSGETTVNEAVIRACTALDAIFEKRPPEYEKEAAG